MKQATNNATCGRLPFWAACCLLATLSSAPAQTANDDFYIASADSPLSVSAPGVLANDSSGGALTALQISWPANGLLNLNANGSFVYTPLNHFTGIDAFTYQVTDGFQTSSVGVVTIMVLGPGEMFYDNFSRLNNSDSIFPWVPVIGNSEGGTWAITNGVLVGNGLERYYGYAYYQNTNWTDYSVQAQVRFSTAKAASAGILGRLDPTSGAHYSLWIYPEHSSETNITPGNGTAVLQLIKYEDWTTWTLMGKRVKVSGIGTNWHTLKLRFQGSNIFGYFGGKLMASATDDGSIDGQPPFTSGGIGINTWTQPLRLYTFSVDNVLVSTDTVVVANDDAYTVKKNIALHVPAPGILANDSGTGILRAVTGSKPAHGKLVLTKTGGFTYAPQKNFSGSDSFTYYAVDGQATSSVATVTFNILDSAVAGYDFYTLPANTALQVPKPGILGNDQSCGGALKIHFLTLSPNSQFTVTNNGGFTYIPHLDYTGTDTFLYDCTDGRTTSGLATITFTVTPPPIVTTVVRSKPGG